MSLQLTHSAFTQASSRQERLDAFHKLDADEARDILKELHADLQGKPGVLRLLHTSHADKPMKFQRAGDFKQKFLSGEKLERSGQALTALLTQAGIDLDQVQKFQTYAQNRGQRGVETTAVVDLLQKALYPESPDMATALTKLGVSNRQFLGAGSFGAAYKVSLNNQAHVLKLFKPGGEDQRRVLVRDARHSDQDVRNMLQAPAGAGRASTRPVDDEAPAQAPAPARAAGPTRENSLYRAPSPDSSEDDKFLAKFAQNDFDPYADQAPDPEPSLDGAKQRFNNFLLNLIIPGRAQAASDEDLDESQESDDASSSASARLPEPRSAQVGNQALRAAAGPAAAGQFDQDLDESQESDDSSSSASARLSEPSPSQVENPALPADSAPAAAGVPERRLGRSNITLAVRLKDMPGVVQPKFLLVRERQSDGQETVHAVPGGAAFKAWASQRRLAADLVVEGTIMPLAPGKPLMTYKYVGEEDLSTPNVPSAHLHNLARQGLDVLKGLQARGFIHGDIKPENMLYSTGQRQLQFIDTDDLQKISKKPDARLPRAPGSHTRLYLHPMARADRPCGAGRDLFAFGATLLETSLQAKGATAAWQSWEKMLMLNPSHPEMAGLLAKHADKRKALADAARHPKDIAEGSAEHFALQCIAQAMDYEERRVVQGKADVFERYTPDNVDHPLNKLSQHPFLA